MFELLKRWAELEPSIFKSISYSWSTGRNQESHDRETVFDIEIFYVSESIRILQSPARRNYHDRVALLGIVLESIAAHPNLRYNLQNPDGRTHASLLDVDDVISFDSVDGEPAIALLKVYLKWLEARK